MKMDMSLKIINVSPFNKQTKIMSHKVQEWRKRMCKENQLYKGSTSYYLKLILVIRSIIQIQQNSDNYTKITKINLVNSN